MDKRTILLAATFALFFGSVVFSCQTKTSESQEYPLLQSMSYFQRFSQKLWYAGSNENWTLAEFYAHEIHEVAEELIEADVIHDGIELSPLAENTIDQNLKSVEKAINKGDLVSFRQSYKMLIKSCNTCHSATHHDFINITIPDQNPNYNQDFTTTYKESL